jgi:GTP cyclohydrolase II
VSLEIPATAANIIYLRTKREKLGHLLHRVAPDES